MLENSSELGKITMIGQMVSYVFLAAGILIIFFHMIRLASIKDYKTKYDYINKHEINFLWYAGLMFIIASGIYANTMLSETGLLWYFVRIFVTLMLGLIAGVVIQSLLKFYYPFYIEKRLKKLRFKPRISPKSGKAMKLLSEEEEDVYLDEGMQAEENVFSIDYDVWIDEETGYTKIEKYQGHLHALRCSECNYQTLKVAKEEVIKTSSETEDGELLKYFKCGYCGHKEKRSFRIAKLKVQEGEGEGSGGESSTVVA
jgi:hypothetical protein